MLVVLLVPRRRGVVPQLSEMHICIISPHMSVISPCSHLAYACMYFMMYQECLETSFQRVVRTDQHVLQSGCFS